MRDSMPTCCLVAPYSVCAQDAPRQADDPVVQVGGRSSALRGYNGSLIVANDAVLIRRGLRGVLARKRRDPDLRITFDEVVAVRFAPSGWLVGYLQVIERGASVGSSGYLTTIRDHRTVTFLTRSGRWRRAAEEVAARSDVSVEVESAPHYWGGVLAAAGRRRR